MASDVSKGELTKFLEKYPDATEADFKTFQLDKKKWFKGSIVVCCVYGALALILLALTLFYQAARDVLAEKMLTFVITLVGGMIFIIVLLVIQIITFKPRVFSKPKYDNDICPDYWKLKKASDTDLAALAAAGITPEQKLLMAYKCVPDPAVYSVKQTLPGSSATNIYGHTLDTTNSNRPYVNSQSPTTSSDSNIQMKFKKGTPTDKNSSLNIAMGGIAGNSNNLYCDVVYPNLLSAVESNDSKLKTLPLNSLRCEYSKQCGMPWTSVCPNDS